VRAKSSVADPDLGFGIRCLFDPWICDPGWVKKNHDPDPESGMNNTVMSWIIFSKA